MIRTVVKRFFITYCIAAYFLYNPPLSAQNPSKNEAIEVYLSFRHRGVINSMVTTFYKDREFYLPVNEIFSLFQIEHNTDGLIINGHFAIDQIPYSINFAKNIIIFGDKTYQITKDDYILSELDNYLKPKLFYEIFGLDFTIDFNTLSLNLQTTIELPVIAQALRSQRRDIANRNRNEEEKYKLLYGRERPFIDGGFLDYNLSGTYTPDQTVFNINSNIGLQVYGGDLQGLVYGNVSENATNFATNSMRWRYRYVNNPIISTFILGQTNTDGILNQPYTGVRITNEPIEPRRLFDEFEISGTTIPQAEVELYLNNLLIDFQQADEMGFYRFLAPVSYGTSQLDLNIYGPTGRVIERSRRLQIPFNFLPEGVFNYHINAGRLDNPVFGSTQQEHTFQGNGSYGLNNWLTAEAGIEYYGGYHKNIPTFTGTLSSRIFSHYLLTLEAASQAFYRGALNVIYPNSASFSVDYTEFNTGIGMYNSANDDRRINGSIFYPIEIFDTPVNFRATAYTRIRGSSSNTTMRLNSSIRIGKINLRLGYSDRLTDTFNFLPPSSSAYAEASATYNISRNRNLPAYLRGVFLRAQMRYFTTTKQLESIDLVASQSIFKTGRLQVSAGRNFTGGFNLLRFSLIVDFDKVRSSTSFNSSRNNFNFNQNIRGSVGYDSNYDNFIFTSHDQVGRSGAAIKLFTDKNANNAFDEGDEALTARAVRVNRSGATSTVVNDVLYYLQMQPYYFYNLEINKSAIRNPMLVPDIDKFGIITDPNRFKKIEIPFYMSGVIEGKVERETVGGRIGGVAGLKLYLNKVDGEYTQEIRTFSDGSFYAYEIPPGDYTLSIDSTQLKILNSTIQKNKLEFEVQAIPEGDFVEGLYLLLTPINSAESADKTETLLSEEISKCRYQLQLGSFSNLESAEKAAAFLASESPQIIYNEENQLYAVREPAYTVLSAASESVQKLYSGKFTDVAIIHNCDELTHREAGIRYYIQFGAFTHPKRAEKFVDYLRNTYNLDSNSSMDELGYYLVTDGSFTERSAARREKNKILEKYPELDIYIKRKELLTPSINTTYKFQLQLSTLHNASKAQIFIDSFKNEFGFKAVHRKDEIGKYLVFIEGFFNNWKNIVKVKQEIAVHDDFDTPIIHLIESE